MAGVGTLTADFYCLLAYVAFLCAPIIMSERIFDYQVVVDHCTL